MQGRSLVSPPSRKTWWADRYLGAAYVETNGSTAVVYVGGRTIDNRSRIGTFKLNHTSSVPQASKFSPAPVLTGDGTDGFFRDGVSYPWVFRTSKGDTAMLFTGWSRQRRLTVSSPRFQNFLGLATFDSKKQEWKPRSEPLIPDFHLGTGSACVRENSGRSEILFTKFVDWRSEGGQLVPFYKLWWGVLSDDYEIEVGGELGGLEDFANNAISRPAVILCGGRTFFWCSIRENNRYIIVGGILEDHAVLLDPALSLRPSGRGWDSDSVEYAAPFHSGDGISLLYCGNSFGKTGIGIAQTPVKGMEGGTSL